MACIRYGQSKSDLSDWIQAIVKRLKWEMKFPNGCPGKQWYWLFLKWFPDLKFQQAQLLSHQCVGISRHALNTWYCELFEYLKETGNLSLLDELLCIFNIDEMGFPMAPQPTKVLAGKGDPHVYQQGSSDKSQITVLMAATFARHFLRTFIPIFNWLCLGTQQMGGWMPIYLRNGSKSHSSLRWKKLAY